MGYFAPLFLYFSPSCLVQLRLLQKTLLAFVSLVIIAGKIYKIL